MSGQQDRPEGPDLTQGVPLDRLADGVPLQGHVGDDAAILVRRGEEVFAVGAHCTHYSGPLAQGLVVGDTVHCPWHFACFSLRSGEPLRPPALDPIPRWRTETRDGVVVVREKIEQPEPKQPIADPPASVVIVGGGAAGLAAALELRRQGYDGPITMISADSEAPYDRPNLSKDYLAGHAEESWIPLRSPDFYQENGIDLRLRTHVQAIDPDAKSVRLSDGGTLSYGALLLTTGAVPVRLDVPGADRPNVHYLRSLDDCKRIIAAAETAKRVVLVGSGFIGMEGAAALRQRGLEVSVVTPDELPMLKVLGPEIAGHLKRFHEEHGVTFHLKETVTAIEDGGVRLGSGGRVDGDLILVAIGVKPAVELAEAAGLSTDRGVRVDDRLRTSAPGIYAAGDIVRWPDALTGERIRVEHWIVAEQQGVIAARNMLGRDERYAVVPVFWTNQYELRISYVGHAERWDRIDIDGDVAKHDCMARYVRDGRTIAVVTMGRGHAKLEMQRDLDAEAAARPSPG
ncbi:MAG TPA: FAD-dependent oxidoreductase [Azospirillum sp.]|nr:FAD-dependent oxidoreductase [Azospirillum sp.]